MRTIHRGTGQGRLRRGAAVVSAFAVTGLMGVPAAQAVPAQPVLVPAVTQSVADSTLTWGVRASFHNYIQGPIAQGEWETHGIADDGGTFTWSAGAGDADPEEGSGSVSFTGGVHYTGHWDHCTEGEPALDVKIENPTLEFDTTGDVTTGTLYVDYSSLPYDASCPDDLAPFTGEQTPFVDLEFPEGLAVEEDSVSGAATTSLTEAGASEVFAGFYTPGEALDPIDFDLALDPVPEPDEDEEDEATEPEDEEEEATEPEDEEDEATEPEDEDSDDPADLEPSLEVQPSEDIDPEGETVTVTGEDFDTSATALYPVPGRSAGFYAQIGWIDEEWRPSEGADSSTRSNAYSVWVQGDNSEDPYLLWDENEDGTADFTWEVEIDEETLEDAARDDATLAVFTVGAGGATQEVNELAVPISFASPAGEDEEEVPADEDEEGTSEDEDEAPADEDDEDDEDGTSDEDEDAVVDEDDEDGASDEDVPSATLSSDSVAPGDSLVIETTGFEPGEDVLVEINPELGTFEADSEGNLTAEVTIPADLEPGEHTLTLTGQTSGTVVDVDLTVTASDEDDSDEDDENGTSDEDEDTVVEDDEDAVVDDEDGDPSDEEEGTSEDDEDAVEDGEGATAGEVAEICRTAEDGTLSWGVRESFRSYIEGPIASGEWETHGIDHSGGEFVWAGGAGEWSEETEAGSVSFDGGVQFTGHWDYFEDGEPALSVLIENPTVEISGTTGTLYADVESQDLDEQWVGGEQVAFAELELDVDASGDSVDASAVAPTLTAEGAEAFAGFYETGEELDALAVSFGLGEETECSDALPGGASGGSGEGSGEASGGGAGEDGSEADTDAVASGGSGSLAQTGLTVGALGLVSALLVLMGLGALALRRGQAEISRME